MKKKHPFLYSLIRRGIVLVLLLLMILTAYHQSTGQLISPERFFSGMITPFQRIVSKAGQLASDYLQRVKYRSNLEYEYNKLRAQNDDLILRSLLYEELEDFDDNSKEQINIGDESPIYINNYPKASNIFAANIYKFKEKNGKIF